MQLGGKADRERAWRCIAIPTLAAMLANEGGEIARELRPWRSRCRTTRRRVFQGPLGVSKRVAWAEPLALEEVKTVGRASAAPSTTC